jgi:hypothetical protein
MAAAGLEHDPKNVRTGLDPGVESGFSNEIIARVSAMQNCINRQAVLSANEIRDNLAMTTENQKCSGGNRWTCAVERID